MERSPLVVSRTPVKRWIATALPFVFVVIALLLSAKPARVEPSNHMGWALSFDGNNDFVELPETYQIMDPGWESTKTLSLWVRPQGTINCFLMDPAHCNIIFGDRPRWWGISMGNLEGKDKIWVWNRDASGYARVGADYVINEWVHIALVHDNGSLRAYRNGFPVGDVPSGPTEQPAEGGHPVLNIGGVIVNASNYWTFEGQVDEVRLWNYARSQSQILQDMYGELNGDEAGLMAYYRMSDGIGDVLSDNSVNNWQGMLYDGARGLPPDGQIPQWVNSTAADEVIPTPTVTNTPTNTPTPTPDNITVTPTSTPTPTGTIPTVTPTPTSLPQNIMPASYLPLIFRGSS